MNGKKFLQLTLGIILFLLMIYIIGIDALLTTLQKLSYFSIIIMIFHLFFQIYFSSVNIHILLKALGKKVSFREIWKGYIPTWSLGKFLPGGTGELSIIHPLTKNGIPFEEAAFISILDKALTVTTFILVGSLGIWFFFPLSTALFLFIAFVLIFGVMASIFFSKTIKNIIKRFLLRKYAGKFKGFSKNFVFLIREKKKFIFLNIAVTFLKSLFAALAPFAFFYLLNVDINPFAILFINTILVLIGMIPITIGGIGTKEAAAVYLFSFVGVQPSMAFGVYATIRIILMVVAALILGIMVYFGVNYKKEDKKRSNHESKERAEP